MPAGISSYSANGFFNALCNNTSFAVAQVYIQLHTADPGAAGTANVAAETDRMTVSFGTASGGAISNDVAVTWTNITGSEDAQYFSLWDNSTGGNFLGSGSITANAYTAGDTFTIPIGDLDLSLTIATT